MPVTIDFYGLTAAPLVPQRVVGYRPTYFILLGRANRSKGHLAAVLYTE
jgi:hypothetical protein